MENRTCAVDGCDRAPRSGKAEWCNTHYFRWRRTGDLGSAEIWDRKRKECSIPDCGDVAVGNGYCSRHHQRVRAHGDPNYVTTTLAGERHGSWKGRDIGYRAAHERVRAVNGAAGCRQCAHCGGQARHWAYDHADPDEMQCDRGPYSANVDH